MQCCGLTESATVGDFEEEGRGFALIEIAMSLSFAAYVGYLVIGVKRRCVGLGGFWGEECIT